jgi:hypothetical protein
MVMNIKRSRHQVALPVLKIPFQEPALLQGGVLLWRIISPSEAKPVS